MSELPDEIWETIFHHFTFKARWRYLAPVCKQWKEVISTMPSGEVDLTSTERLDDARVAKLCTRFNNISILKIPSTASLSPTGFGDLILSLNASLTSLDLEGVSWLGLAVPEHFEKCLSAVAKRLRVLKFSAVPFVELSTDEVHLATFKGWTLSFPALERLHVTQAIVSTATVEYIGAKCPSLKHLKMLHGKFQFDSIRPFPLQAIAHLKLKTFAMNTKGAVTVEELLETFPLLKELEVHGKNNSLKARPVSAPLLRVLRSTCNFAPLMVTAPSLRHLALKNSDLTPDNLPEFLSYLQELPHLEVLSIRRAECITDDIMRSMLMTLPNLTSLSLQTCQPGRDPFGTLVDTFPNIRHLTIGNGRGDGMEATLEGKCLIESLRFFPNLTSLRLLALEALDDTGLELLPSVCPNLSLLDIMWCTEITSAGVLGVVTQLSKLREFYFYGCSNLNEEFLEGVAKARPELQTLECGDGCITLDQLCTLLVEQHLFPELRTLWFTPNDQADVPAQFADGRPEVTVITSRKIRFNV